MITVCGEAEESCPVIPDVRHLHWPIPDPARATGSPEEILDQFRAVCEEIARRIGELF